ncbi:GNAT family N-acetyltransferase [Chitinimonas koreensis]|nr:GNAT family N-acetyltransferase [Chitinimonas koreensis]
MLARPFTVADLDFLCALYVSTRLDELAEVQWSEADKLGFLTQQFAAQHCYYQEHYADAQRLLLLREGRPIGRLYWWADAAAAVLIDVSLLPDARGQGIGRALMQLLVGQADRLGLPITLHVEPTNPAQRLYRRFGFETIAQSGVYDKMRRSPAHEASRP